MQSTFEQTSTGFGTTSFQQTSSQHSTFQNGFESTASDPTGFAVPPGFSQTSNFDHEQPPIDLPFTQTGFILTPVDNYIPPTKRYVDDKYFYDKNGVSKSEFRPPPPPEVKSRNPSCLVLCFDGTGNEFTGGEEDTNIVKIYKYCNREKKDQYHYYQRTSRFHTCPIRV